MRHAPTLPSNVLEALCQRHHIRRMAYFGSVLRTDFGPDSDLDILVEFEPGHTPGLAFFALQAELSALLGRAVDLNTPAWLGPRLMQRIRDEAEVIFDAA
jgi:predicted nucleotidyltransferase